MNYLLSIRSLQESNVSSDFESQSIDTAFRKVTHNSIGFYKWRVENNRIETVPKDQYDKFNDNCVYIIYAASPKGSFVNKNTINREMKTNIQLDKYIHFWIGNAATQQQSGNVSYKVMELDNHLGNTATQYRETQENESDRFLSYFKEGLIIQSITNNLSKATLFHVIGKFSPKCVERKLDWNSFSSEFVMILKTTSHIFLWIGRSSEESEKSNGLKFARQFHDVEKNVQLVVVNDGYEQSLIECRKIDWSIYLPLSNRRVNPLGKCVDNPTVRVLKLYQCGFIGGKYRIEERKSFADQNDLNDKNSTFIVDCAEKGVWIWLGRNCSTRDKSEAMRNARGFVRKKQYSSDVSVIRTVDGYEPYEFRNLFSYWYNAETTLTKMKNVFGKIDSKILSERASLAAETQLIDDGGGDMVIFKVSKTNLVKLAKRKAQFLFSTESYVIHYTLTILENNLLTVQPLARHIIYLWQGKQCPSEIKSVGKKLSNELFQRLQKNAVQICLHDGFESPHFLQIFHGKLIIFDSVTGSEEDFKFPKIFLLKVTGTSSYTSLATQITKDTTFCSKDCVIVKTYDSIWVWCGQSSTGDAREAAKKIGETVGEYTLVTESNEPEGFWLSLPDPWNGKFRHLPNMKEPAQQFSVEKERVRLFVCSFIQGTTQFNQIMAFDQTDLKPEDVFILDFDCMLYIWIGSFSIYRHGQLNAHDVSQTYLNGSMLPRNKFIPIAIVQQGFEPSCFIGFFDKWDNKLWNPNQQDFDFDKFPKYPLDVLRSEVHELPDAVDPKRKEVHLTNDDFVSLFDMNFSDFEMLPNWRKQELKKKLKLF
ncbi:Villin-like protein quail, partial [Pseudolycoriella hygida]